MSTSRPKLQIVRDGSTLTESDMHDLRARFDIIEVQSDPASADAAPQSAARIVERLGDGAGVVNHAGERLWIDARLRDMDAQVREAFTEQCLAVIEQFNAPDQRRIPWQNRRNSKADFSVGDRFYEVVISPAAADQSGRIEAVVGVIWETTAAHARRNRIRAIDDAGAELLNIEPTALEGKTIADRLKLLEEKIVKDVHGILHFDNFEVRLMDEQTRQLELVISVGLTPLKIGEVIYAEEEGNGISGFVAATGKSYLCPDVTRDPRYTDGLQNAGSSLTVPLRLQDEVIGVFNIESYTPNQFDQNDLLYAELFARYIAAAINILDLLVVERYTTNEQVARNVVGELSEPLADITARAIELQAGGQVDPHMRESLDRIVASAEQMRRRIEVCTSGPRSILGAEQAMDNGGPDDAMLGKRVLVADDEPMIRDTMAQILQQKGCVVSVCCDGREAIDTVESDQAEHEPFDLVISDIRMPGNTGYEVFRATKTRNARTEVILMTGFGYDPHHSIVRATQEGLHSFLFKPFKASQMLDVVRGALVPPLDG